MHRHEIRTFPATDASFADAARHALTEFDSGDVEGHADVRNDPAMSVERLLQRSFPRARVVRMDDLASFDPDTVVLYAFRDGAVTRDTD